MFGRLQGRPHHTLHIKFSKSTKSPQEWDLLRSLSQTSILAINSAGSNSSRSLSKSSRTKLSLGIHLKAKSFSRWMFTQDRVITVSLQDKYASQIVRRENEGLGEDIGTWYSCKRFGSSAVILCVWTTADRSSSLAQQVIIQLPPHSLTFLVLLSWAARRSNSHKELWLLGWLSHGLKLLNRVPWFLLPTWRTVPLWWRLFGEFLWFVRPLYLSGPPLSAASRSSRCVLTS